MGLLVGWEDVELTLHFFGLGPGLSDMLTVLRGLCHSVTHVLYKFSLENCIQIEMAEKWALIGKPPVEGTKKKPTSNYVL